DALETAFTITIDHKSTDTGISAFERSFTIQQMMNEDVVASDFVRPGHVFPLIAKENGVLERKGHTEAAVDLAKLAGTQPRSEERRVGKEGRPRWGRGHAREVAGEEGGSGSGGRGRRGRRKST